MGDLSLNLRTIVIFCILFICIYISVESSVKMANETQRDCRICHGKIDPKHIGKPPFIEYGVNYLRLQITKERYAPLYDYRFIKDLYPSVRYNRELKKIHHRNKLTKSKTLISQYKSVFSNCNPKYDTSDPELKIAARNQLKHFSKKYEFIEFIKIDLRTIKTQKGKHQIYFKFIFDALHLRVLPNFLDEIEGSNYFSLKNDPNIKYVASNHPLHKTHRHFYKVIQEGIIHPEEFGL